MSCLKVGVLALQGAFLEHAEKLCEVGRTDQVGISLVVFSRLWLPLLRPHLA
jgi:hypothetical protein